MNEPEQTGSQDSRFVRVYSERRERKETESIISLPQLVLINSGNPVKMGYLAFSLTKATERKSFVSYIGVKVRNRFFTNSWSKK